MEAKEYERVRRALAAAYEGKRPPPIREQFSAGVLGRVRSLALGGEVQGFLAVFQGLVWRLAPAACVLVLLLGVAVSQLDFGSDYELASALMEDPAEFSVLDLYR